jgi:NAD(P)-dependent dehydrogenase (short-subunit alcohol dehydrogenase family)
MRYIVITGVSSGIGYAAATDLLGRGYHVFGSVRRLADADRLRHAWGERFTPLLFDVTEPARLQTAVEQVASAVGDQGLAALINNAGIATPGPLLHLPMEDFRVQFEVNVFGLLAVTQQFLPLLGARPDAPHPPGRLINISSVSGRLVYPFMGAYAASKHAVEAISDALRRELLLYGIQVIVIQPGTVRTPIVGKFADQVERFMGTDYGRILAPIQAAVGERERSAIPVERVTAVIRTALEAPHPKTRYPIPRKWLTGWLLPRLLPDRWFDRLVARSLKIKL